jgi:hypothetical protein
MDDVEINSPKLKDLIEPVKPVLNAALPLVETPPLDRIQSALMMEFPCAVDAIDFALADLIGRPVVKMRPLLLVGEPGGGKSRFAHRFGEALGLPIWRIDAAQSDGSAMGGTDRRWHSAECCHPLLAIARGRNANPLILIDELEKAATRTDYGRLWDCLLGLFEPETSSRYPDPALQIPLDLSHVNYLPTANSLEPLPAPLRDRFQIVMFPKPTIEHLDALLPSLLQAIATERGVHARWIAPINAIDRAAIAKHWPAGRSAVSSASSTRSCLRAIEPPRDTETGLKRPTAALPCRCTSMPSDRKPVRRYSPPQKSRGMHRTSPATVKQLRNFDSKFEIAVTKLRAGDSSPATIQAQ